MKFNSLKIIQPSGKVVFAFASTVDDILKVVEIPRIGRSNDGILTGYQRPELINHINEIRRYIEGIDAVLPNTIVVAFDDTVTFTPLPSIKNLDHSEFGLLEVIPPSPGARSPGFVVDGQQRLAAIASSKHKDFPVFITAMIASCVEEQRKQFVLVNRTKPLPQSMVFELLPEIDGILPQYLAKQRFAANVVAQLNLRPESVLFKKIKTPTCPYGYIKDNSMRRLVLNSINDGALFDIQRHATDRPTSLNTIIEFITIYWTAISNVFGGACNLPPQKSRLTHGVGIVSLGYFMDYIYLTKLHKENWNEESIMNLLRPLQDNCAWTEGSWFFDGFGSRRWNELQNIDRDIRLLTNHLIRLVSTIQ